MRPFINQLLQDARVGMLRDEACAQHFQALGGDLGDDRRIVEKPPAAERYQIAKLSRSDTKLVLVFA